MGNYVRLDMLQERYNLTGVRRQPVGWLRKVPLACYADACFNCMELGHWCRECPKNGIGIITEWVEGSSYGQIRNSSTETRNFSGDLVGRPDRALELLGRPGTHAGLNQLNLDEMSPREGVGEACLDVKLHSRSVCVCMLHSIRDANIEYSVDGCRWKQCWNRINNIKE